jgi:pSer/pThr/pTyr-binding forkhead associated (FHA) protein/S1-C subfamily serine protease
VILHDERRKTDVTIEPAGARIGRDPALDITFPDDESLVSAVHARLWREGDGSWWIQDLGSTNGTWLNGRKLAASERLRSGDRFSLGQRGPGFRVTVPGEIKRTQQERPIDVSQPLLRLRRVSGGEDLIGMGDEILIGRAATCSIPLRTVADTVVSKRHAVVEIAGDGAATITDLESKNGTFVNGSQIIGKGMLRVGDRIMLGWHGPLFEVRILGPAVMAEGEGAAYHPELQPPKTLAGMVQAAQSMARESGAVKTGVFMRAMARQMARESSVAFRVTVLGGMVGFFAAAIYVYQAAAKRTAAAESRLASTEHALAVQIREASEQRRRAQDEIISLQRDLASARRSSVNRAVIDSLERRLRAAETRAARPQPEGGSGASADFARVALENQRAVGLVIVRTGTDSVMGSGFVITPSGYFVTNRHVVQGDAGATPRSIDVIMADTRTPLPADLIAVSAPNEPDIAVLRIRNYRGDVVQSVDWQGTGVHQGGPAALIGFPYGTQLAFDQTRFVRTSMFAGIISQATAEYIRFGGTTFRGASGSPIFNAEGTVIAVHFGGLSEGQGLGFSVPVRRVLRYLPADARAEVGH